MKNLIVILILISSISAQYKKEFKDLIETTYLRTFDEKIVLKYLNSESEDSIKAALLTIANSNQTKFIENIINVDNDYLVEKSFALGKLDADSLSEKFLLENLNNVESDFLPLSFLSLYEWFQFIVKKHDKIDIPKYWVTKPIKGGGGRQIKVWSTEKLMLYCDNLKNKTFEGETIINTKTKK